MTMFKRQQSSGFSLLLLLCAVTCSPLSFADNSKSFGDYEVFYSVLNSTFIKPDVAEAYGIVRARDRALINIAVRKTLASGATEASAVKLSGKSSDLIHSLPLTFREIREGPAIYYIAELPLHDKELRTFTIEIQTEPTIAPYTLKFTQKLYED